MIAYQILNPKHNPACFKDIQEGDYFVRDDIHYDSFVLQRIPEVSISNRIGCKETANAISLNGQELFYFEPEYHVFPAKPSGRIVFTIHW